MRRGLFALLLLLLAACGGPASRSYTSPQRAIEGWLDTAVNVFQEVPSGRDRLLIFQGPTHPAPLIALVEDAGWGRWQSRHSVTLSPLSNIGPVSLRNQRMGTVKVKAKPPATYTTTYARTLVFYGVVNDPRITWVEVTLPEKPDSPMKAAVVNGTWLVQWPWQIGFPPFPKAALRAGDASGQLFAFPDVWAAPIVKE